MIDNAASTPNVTGRRIVAALIDVAILLAVFVVMVLLFGDTGTERSTTTGDSFRRENTNFQFNLEGAPALVYAAIVLLYYFATELALRATPGKLIIAPRVVSLNDQPLTPWRIVLRNLLRIVDGLPVLYIVGVITIAVSKNDQRLGDMASGTGIALAEANTSPPIAA